MMQSEVGFRSYVSERETRTGAVSGRGVDNSVSLMWIIVISLVVLAISVDAFSCTLGIRRLRGNGPSGVPGIGLIIAAIATTIAWGCSLISGSAAKTWMLWYTVVHVSLNFGALLCFELILRVLSRFRSPPLD